MQLWQEVAGVVALGALLVFVATDSLIGSPPTWFDEGIYIQVAMNDALHGVEQLQVAPGTYVSPAFVTGGYTFLKPISYSFQLFGIGLLQARAVMVVFIVLCVFAFWLLIRFLYGPTVALCTLALLVTFPPLYGQGKNVLGEVPGLLYLGLLLFALIRAEQTAFSELRWYVLAGLAAGLCVATKPVYLLVLGAIAVAALIQYRTVRRVRIDGILLGACVFCIPVGAWVASQFWLGDSTTTVLTYYANPYGFEDVWAQVLTNALRFVTEVSPLYCAVLMALWVIAIGVRFVKKEPVSFAELTALVFAVLVMGAYLRTAGWYRYFFYAELVALAFVPAALVTCAARLWPSCRMLVAVLGVCVLCTVQLYQLFFASWVALQDTTPRVRAMEAYVDSRQSATYFLFNAPEAAVFLKDQPYYQYLVLGMGTASLPLGTEGFAALDAGIPDVVVATDPQFFSTYAQHLGHYGPERPVGKFVIKERQ